MLICPRCGASLIRSRTRRYERVLPWFTRRRPHRCSHCTWRGWRRPE